MPVTVVSRYAPKVEDDIARENGECMIDCVPCNKAVECSGCQVYVKIMEEVLR